MSAKRLTDAQALAQMSSTTRALIKSHGFVRCLIKPNAWHRAIPTTPSDYGNGRKPHASACKCRVPVRARGRL